MDLGAVLEKRIFRDSWVFGVVMPQEKKDRG